MLFDTEYPFKAPHFMFLQPIPYHLNIDQVVEDRTRRKEREKVKEKLKREIKERERKIESEKGRGNVSVIFLLLAS